MPRLHLPHTTPAEFAAGLAAIRAELDVPASFPVAVEAAAETAAARAPGEGASRVDRRDLELVTVDPPGSRDLDQAYGAERRGSGYRVHYAIADVAAFVAPGGALDGESRARGVTLYLPDGRAPLYPPALAEGAGSLLLEQPDLTEAERRTLLEQIRQETRWLTRITENMLSVTRMAGEQVSLHRTDEVVEEIVDSAVMKLRRSRNALPVTVIRPQEILTAPMDATLMEQVILNLLENAVNHAEGATRIRVEIAGQGDTVMIAVEDDGAGFPPELLPQLFDRKLLPQPRSCADGRRGLGLGLTLCSAIIKAHGGRMTAENRPEGGARVCLWLPAGTEDEEETEG